MPHAQAASWFFENADVLFGVFTAEGRFVSANPAWEAITGWTCESLIGRPFLDLVHPASRETTLAGARTLAAGGTASGCIRFACKDGGWAWLDGYLRTGPRGDMMGMFRDVTDERRQADALAQAKDVEIRLSKAAGVGLWRYDPRAQTLDWSAEWTAMLADAGVKMENGADFVAVCHPEDLAATVAAMETAAQGTPCAVNHRFRSYDGRWTWVRANMWAEPVGDGEFIVHGISQIVTELAEAQADAVAHNHRLKIALGAARGAVVEIDYEKQALWFSPEFVELTGWELTFAQAHTSVWPCVHPDDAPTAEAGIARMHAEGVSEPMDLRMVPADGRPARWFRVYIEPERDLMGLWLRAIVLVIDIDDTKRQELALIAAERQAQAAGEAKSQFLANMSHEIRTPMNGVLGVLHLLKGKELPAHALDLVEEALGCGVMLQALLDDVVDFSKIEAGKLEITREPTDPTVLVESVVKMLRPSADDRGLELRLAICDLPDWVLADAVRVQQCLFNLVGNAVKFTQAGSITVRAGRAAEPDRLRFEVEDTGIGIDEEAKARLFQRFQQADSTTTRRFGGSGLGLAITRRLAEIMGGEVGLSSVPGQGSTFWFEIHAPHTAAPASGAGESGDLLQGLRILLVEDNPTNRLIAGKLLEGLGAEVHLAEDGERGVEAALVGAFDLILMDIQMPGIDGMEATRRIRSSGGPAAQTPIVALTANVLSHQCETYLAAGMDGVVGKPVSPTTLLNEIARLAGHGDEAAAAGEPRKQTA